MLKRVRQIFLEIVSDQVWGCDIKLAKFPNSKFSSSLRLWVILKKGNPPALSRSTGREGENAIPRKIVEHVVKAYFASATTYP